MSIVHSVSRLREVGTKVTLTLTFDGSRVMVSAAHDDVLAVSRGQAYNFESLIDTAVRDLEGQMTARRDAVARAARVAEERAARLRTDRIRSLECELDNLGASLRNLEDSWSADQRLLCNCSRVEFDSLTARMSSTRSRINDLEARRSTVRRELDRLSLAR